MPGLFRREKNLECLKNEKVILDITNYGESSRAHDDLVSLAIKKRG